MIYNYELINGESVLTGISYESLEIEKTLRIDYLKNKCKEDILNNYPAQLQLAIALNLKTPEDLENLKKFVSTALLQYNTLVSDVNLITEVENITSVDWTPITEVNEIITDVVDQYFTDFLSGLNQWL